MANPALGAKQICPNCQTKFYDLNKRPATCPACSAQFDPEEALKSRVRSRARAPAPDYESDEKPAQTAGEDADELEEADDTPEIDAEAAAEPLVVDDEDDSGAPAEPEPAEDIGVDFEEDADLAETAEDDEDVPFLEDEAEEGFDDGDVDLGKDDEDR